MTGNITVDLSAFTKALEQVSESLAAMGVAMQKVGVEMANSFPFINNHGHVVAWDTSEEGDYTVSYNYAGFGSVWPDPCKKCGFEMHEHREHESFGGACVVRVHNRTLRIERVKLSRAKPLPQGRAIDLSGRLAAK